MTTFITQDSELNINQALLQAQKDIEDFDQPSVLKCCGQFIILSSEMGESLFE